jgi:hypothetical protein
MVSWFAGYVFKDFVVFLLFDGLRLQKMTVVLGQGSQVARKDAEEQHFYVVHHFRVLQHVPAKSVPELTASFAAFGPRDPLPDVTLSNINGHRSIEQDVNPLPTFAAPRNTGYVLGVSRPHRSALAGELPQPIAIDITGFNLDLARRC